MTAAPPQNESMTLWKVTKKTKDAGRYNAERLFEKCTISIIIRIQLVVNPLEQL